MAGTRCRCAHKRILLLASLCIWLFAAQKHEIPQIFYDNHRKDNDFAPAGLWRNIISHGHRKTAHAVTSQYVAP